MKWLTNMFDQWFMSTPDPISVNSACPACGNRGCRIQFDPVANKVVRTCNTCGCVVQQPPIASHLFGK